MTIKTHRAGHTSIAELISDEMIVRTVDDGLDLLGNLFFQGFDKVIIHGKNITPGFFDLKTGIAGDILQKFTNYRVRLAIVGDFAEVPGKSLRDFIFESNKGKQVNFVNSAAEAIETLSR
ncbi:DUF4180 domain-containing protein [Chitinophaga sp. YIM B06452]|uniref:DUF4180 domain-containing protein n=1 Tax=Chitinophaga sp. YIM B06452 TaxID=3082158 RepID=UPI0031FEB6A0